MNKIPEVINQTLEVLSAKFGVGVEALWNIMVRQQLFEGKAHLIIGIVFFVLFMGCIIGLMKLQDEDVVVAICMIGLFFLIIACVFLYASYMELVNPQYQAIKEFLEVFKNID